MSPGDEPVEGDRAPGGAADGKAGFHDKRDKRDKGFETLH
jgi:hypothetical protein